MGFSHSSSTGIGAIICVNNAYVSLQCKHTLTHIVHVLSIHWYKAGEKSWTYCTHTSPDNTHTLWPHTKVHFNPTAGPIDSKHHRHRSERIPVREDRIVNVSWSDGRQREREVVSDSIHSHMKRKWRERGVFHPLCCGCSCKEKWFAGFKHNRQMERAIRQHQREGWRGGGEETSESYLLSRIVL